MRCLRETMRYTCHHHVCAYVLAAKRLITITVVSKVVVTNVNKS